MSADGSPLIKGGPADYYDSYHAPNKAYYTLDFDVTSGKTAEVVAAHPGTIAGIQRFNDPSTPIDDRYVVVYHEHGFYTKYGEFAPASDLHVGQIITGEQFEQGLILGKLTGVSGEHLHFQVEHSKTGGLYNFGPGLSMKDNISLEGIKINGILFSDYKLNRDPSTTVNINGDNGALPLQTQIRNISFDPIIYSNRNEPWNSDRCAMFLQAKPVPWSLENHGFNSKLKPQRLQRRFEPCHCPK